MKKIITLLLCSGLALSVYPTHTWAVSAQETDETEQEQPVSEHESPQGAYQLDITYPLQAENGLIPGSLSANQFHRFTGYEGQGYLWLQMNGINDYQVYINNHLIEITTNISGAWQKIDISDLTVNGENILQINRVDAGNGTLSIKVPYPVLTENTASWSENDNFKLIDEIIQAEIDHGFSSAQVLVMHNGEVIKQTNYGLANSFSPRGERLTEGTEISNDTMYDLGSNTEHYATKLALQRLVSEGKVNLDEKVSTYLTGFEDNPFHAIRGKNDLTVRDLLVHQSGFPAHPEYHNNNYDASAENGLADNANDFFTQERKTILEQISATPLAYTPRTQRQYSDVDYLLLGLLVEEVTGQRLDEYVQETFYGPLALEHTSFNPLDNGFEAEDTAASELNGNTFARSVEFDNIRTETIHGEVHNGTAYYTMEGVSGHAGLFASAADLAVLNQVQLNQGGYGEEQFFSSEAAGQFADSAMMLQTEQTDTFVYTDEANHFAFILLTNAKNTPLVRAEGLASRFAGEHYITGQADLLAALAANAIHSDSKGANDGLVIDLIIQKFDYVSQEEADINPADQAALDALYDVLHYRKEGSPIITRFVEPSVYQEIESYLTDMN